MLQQSGARAAPTGFGGVGIIWHSVIVMGRGLLARIPYLIVAFFVFFLFWAAGKIIKVVIARMARREGRGEPAALVFGRLASFGLIIIGIAVAAVIIFPEFTFGSLLGALGIGSVAIGFAFQNVLQNFLAGILLLWRRPFFIGDQIKSGDYEGTVLGIDIRATRIKTYDGELVILPNSDVFTNAVVVRTAFDNRRVRLDIPVDFGQSLGDALKAVTEVVNNTEGVLSDPGPWVYTTGVAGAATISAFFWTGSQQKNVLAVTNRVATAIDEALKKVNVDLAPPTDVRLHQVAAQGDGNGAKGGGDAKSASGGQDTGGGGAPSRSQSAARAADASSGSGVADTRDVRPRSV